VKYVIQLLIVLFACTIGKICGMGGDEVVKGLLAGLKQFCDAQVIKQLGMFLS